MTSQAIHPLDAALALTPTAAAGVFTGHTTPDYWNMVGPYGGITAATLLQAVLQHPDLLGEPLSLTVNYAAAVTEGPLTLQVQPIRTNRSTQHWSVLLLQPDAQGQEQVVSSASAVTAVRRSTWGVSDAPMPAVPAPAEVAAVPVPENFPVQWIKRYEMRPITGSIPEQWNDQGDSSLSQLWVRDRPQRALGFAALAGLADVFFPRVWLRRARRVPIGTVSMTVYFHAGSAELAAVGSGYLLGQARAQEFRNGFFDQSAQLWSEAGQMLASTHQIVYYKE
ncbi:thioesterase family protein [Melaminivora sp.]